MKTVQTLAFRGEVEMSSASTTSVSYIRLQAGLVRENISLPDSVELAISAGPGVSSDHALLAFIRDAADSFVSRRVSTPFAAIAGT